MFGCSRFRREEMRSAGACAASLSPNPAAMLSAHEALQRSFRKRPFRSRLALQMFVVAGIVLNAIVTGALSGPYDRYLARVIWLILFVGLVCICCIMRVHTHKQVFKSHKAR
jgi:hypothetical protein